MPWSDPQFEDKKESKEKTELNLIDTLGWLPRITYRACHKGVNYFLAKFKKFSLTKYYSLFLEEFQNIQEKIESTPHLNFLSLLQTYKIVIEVLDGTVAYFHRNRNQIWFKHFFPDEELYNLVKEEIKLVNARFPNVKLTITKEGTLIFDNYKKNKFNILALTVHNGHWMPKHIQDLQRITKEQRYYEEDIGTNCIYGPLALIKGGIWINVCQSRFVCDYNRSIERAIYTNNSEKRLKNIWKSPLKASDREYILSRYKNFYFVLNKLIDTHRFNIIFDGHSMVNERNRPPISFGIKYVPKFYLPIVNVMRMTFQQNTKIRIHINKPYSGGQIPRHLSEKFPDVFIFSMEINKSMYMDHKHMKMDYFKARKMQENLIRMFDF